MPDDQDQDQLIPTLAMARDPRLRRLFAHVGRALNEAYATGDFVSDSTLESLHDDILDLAPEYLPPDDTDADDLTEEWAALVEEATR